MNLFVKYFAVGMTVPAPGTGFTIVILLPKHKSAGKVKPVHVLFLLLYIERVRGTQIQKMELF